MNFDETFQNLLLDNEEEKVIKETYKATNQRPFINDSFQHVSYNDLSSQNSIIISKHPRHCKIGKHKHNYIEINYVYSGQVTEQIDGKKITLKQGEMVLMSVNSVHELYPCGNDDILINLIILPSFFDFAFTFLDENINLLKFLSTTVDERQSVTNIVFHVSDNQPVQNLMKNLIFDYYSDDTLRETIIKHDFTLLLLQLMRNIGAMDETNYDNNDSTFKFKILSYLESNYQNANLQTLEKLLNQDYSYISKKIKKLIGKSFSQLVEDKRINVSKDLLINTNVSIENVATYVGYNNLTFFYNLFKKKTGFTPKQFRELEQSKKAKKHEK